MLQDFIDGKFRKYKKNTTAKQEDSCRQQFILHIFSMFPTNL